MARVFFLTSKMDMAKFNIYPAKKFGEIVWVTNDSKLPEGNELADFVVKRLEEMNFNPDEDYIALTGPTPLLPFFLAAVVYWYESVSILTYSAASKEYKTLRYDWQGPMSKGKEVNAS